MGCNHYDLRGHLGKGSGVRILRRKISGRSRVFRRIHVVKRIDRPVGPVRQRDAMPRRPDLDLAQVFLRHRAAQVAAQDNGIEWMLSVPGDCPFLPEDLVERLHQARRKMGAGVPLACARSGEWRHPVVGLWPVALREDLRHALTVEDLRKIEVWTARHGIAVADWPTEPVDPFFNVNTPDDAKRAQELAQP